MPIRPFACGGGGERPPPPFPVGLGGCPGYRWGGVRGVGLVTGGAGIGVGGLVTGGAELGVGGGWLQEGRG